MGRIMKYRHWNFLEMKPSSGSGGVISGLLWLFMAGLGVNPGAYAQVMPPITSSGLNTQVSAPTSLPTGQINYNITGGTRPGNGANLFHSFGEFNVPTNNIANFLNETALPTSNILSRVTAGNPSSIFGTIQTTGFGNANLFLINPAGVLFGATATLNVGGSFYVGTADYLRLTDGARFSAIPDPVQDALLKSAPVAAFGFLSSNRSAVTVQGSQLFVTDGQGISLVGGSIEIKAGELDDGTVQPARLSASAGQINLASLASPGEVLLASYQTAPLPGEATSPTLGSIALSQGSTLDVSADGAGTVQIRGGLFVITDATISADTGDTNGAPVAIDINITGDLSISDTRGMPAITARTTGAGNAGEVQIASANLEATTSFPTDFVLIDSHTSGSGMAGKANITTDNLSASGQEPTFVFIDSGTQGVGSGGDVAITANTILLDRTTITTGTQLANILGVGASGPSGNLTITADSLQLANAYLVTDSISFFVSSFTETQRAGDITLNVRDLNMVNGTISAIGVGRGGAITTNGDSLLIDNTLVETDTALLPGGGITVNARAVELTNGSSLISSTFGDGKAGDILVTATDHVSLVRGTGELGVFNPPGLFSNSFGGLGNLGDAGDIVVTTPTLLINEGRINTSTATSGRGGNVTINADVILISGEFPHPFGVPGWPDVTPDPIFPFELIHPSGIITRTVGSDFCAGPCGNAGEISITTGSLAMGPGSQIDSGTSSTGRGGTITINAMDTISISGTLSDGTPGGIFSRTIGMDPGSGVSGNIALTAGQSVTLSNGAAISASSTGPANAGAIEINAGNQFLSTSSSVTTQATAPGTEASGGNITISASDMVHLINSQITTSVQGGPETVGGNITIDPQFVILQNSQILAQATQGQGGNINIVAGSFIADPASLVSASSQLGVSGTVNIQSPVQNFSSVLAPLPKNFQSAAALLAQRCAARVAGGQVSTFVMAGREGLPAEPGGFLTSPPYRTSATGVAGEEPVAFVPTVLVAMADRFPVWDVGCRFENVK
jgi:filamentous hemagglutinin family protein